MLTHNAAFCRIFRIGQEQETELVRFVVKDTIDTKLTNMQDTKSEIVSTAMGDQSRPGKLGLKELVKLFGSANETDAEREFILVDDANDYDERMPPVGVNEEDAAKAERESRSGRTQWKY
jgi:hypothetical protein